MTDSESPPGPETEKVAGSEPTTQRASEVSAEQIPQAEPRRKRGRKLNGSDPELDLVQVRSIDSITPCPENDDIYKAIAWDDPDIHQLAQSIKEHGVQEPILISSDGFIISGHRRRVASYLAKLDLVPVRVHPISRAENPEAFIKLLVGMNSQRIKSASELVHESLIKIDPKAAHEQIVNGRKDKDEERSCNSLTAIDPDSDGARCEISQAKQPFLDAILRILTEQFFKSLNIGNDQQ